MRFTSIAFACYRFIAIPSLIITIILSVILIISGTSLALVLAVWTKLITTSLILFYVYFFRSSWFYFFNNLGFTVSRIYITLAFLDLSIALSLFLISLII